MHHLLFPPLGPKVLHEHNKINIKQSQWCTWKGHCCFYDTAKCSRDSPNPCGMTAICLVVNQRFMFHNRPEVSWMRPSLVLVSLTLNEVGLSRVDHCKRNSEFPYNDSSQRFRVVITESDFFCVSHSRSVAIHCELKIFLFAMKSSGSIWRLEADMLLLLVLSIYDILPQRNTRAWVPLKSSERILHRG